MTHPPQNYPLQRHTLGFHHKASEDEDSYIIMMFDDGYDDCYTNAFPIMQEYGFKGVANIVTSLVGTFGYMTLSELRELTRQGWEISSHSVSHANFNTLTRAQCEDEIRNSRDYIIRNLQTRVFTWTWPANQPNDIEGVGTQILARRYYPYVCPTPGTHWMLRPTNDIYRAGVDETWTAAYFRSWIAARIAAGECGVMYFHHVTPSPPAGGISPTHLRELFNVIVDQGWSNRVKTFQDVAEVYSFPLNEGWDRPEAYEEKFFSVKGNDTLNCVEPHHHGQYNTIEESDNQISYIYFSEKVPSDFVSLLAIRAVVIAEGVGDVAMRVSYASDYGLVGENYNANSESIAYSNEPVTANKITELRDLSSMFTALARGTHFGFRMIRDATHAGDTVDGPVQVLGFVFRYIKRI